MQEPTPKRAIPLRQAIADLVEKARESGMSDEAIIETFQDEAQALEDGLS